MSGEALFADRFELVARRGAGMNGVVWRARDRATGELVALKILHEKIAARVARFSREARILARLEHPRIARYRAHGVSESSEPYLAMEWLEGETLAERLRHGRPPLGDAIRIVRGIAEGLAAAHAMEVIHRDIKPSNIFLVGGDPSAVKILDFGVARRRGSMTRTLTVTDAFVGTLSTMAPEQIFGAHDAGAFADLYSLGCVLFECVAGRPPLEGRNATEMISKVLGEVPIAPSELDALLPQELDALVASLLEKSPWRRPDATAVIAALDALPIGPEADARPRAGLRISRAERVPLCIVAVRSEGELLSIEGSAALERGRVMELGVDAALVYWRHPLAELRRARRFALALPETCRAAVAIGFASESAERLVGEVVGRVVEAAGDASRDRVSFDRESLLLLSPPAALRGRERELARVAALRERCAIDGARALLLVVGEAGIGKSALVRALDGVDVLEDVDETDPLDEARAWLGREGAGTMVATARDPSPAWRALADEELRLRPLGARVAEAWVGAQRSASAGGVPAILALAGELDTPACALERSAYFAEDDATRRALRAAAIAGESFDAELVGAVLDEDAGPLLRAAMERGVLAQGFRFARALDREAALAALVPADRRIASRIVAEQLESREAPSSPARNSVPLARADSTSAPLRSGLRYDVPEVARAAVASRRPARIELPVRRTSAETIARCLLEGGLTVRALPWLARAARDALSRGEAQGALAHVRCALDQGPPAAARGELLAIGGRAELELGQLEAAVAHLLDACELLIAGTQPWYAAMADAARAHRASGLDLSPLRERVEREPAARGAESARDACLAALSADEP